jgi:catechol 2,3-dioxygenase-like lactoylglutathione lyase family enzyme
LKEAVSRQLSALGYDMTGNVQQVVPCLLVTGMERSLRYYLDGLGFVMKNKWVVEDPDGYWLHFDSPAGAPEETKLSEWSRRGASGLE